MICRRLLFAVFFILTTQSISRAQQPDTVITFAGVRGPACAVSTDPGYGLTAAKPIQLGGGPAAAGARERPGTSERCADRMERH